MRHDVRAALEAVLMVADNPVDPSLLAQLLEIPVVEVEQGCRDLAAEYEQQGRGFTVAKVAGGWRFQSAADQAAYVERFVLEGQSSRLSAAAMETLAIVAYKQPISRAQVAAIRGVNVDGVMRSLLSRGYVDEVGRDPGPGQAVLYGTTDLFLEKLGLESPDDLPPLGTFVPDPDIVEALENGLRTPEEQQAVREAVTKGIEVINDHLADQAELAEQADVTDQTATGDQSDATDQAAATADDVRAPAASSAVEQATAES